MIVTVAYVKTGKFKVDFPDTALHRKLGLVHLSAGDMSKRRTIKRLS